MFFYLSSEILNNIPLHKVVLPVSDRFISDTISLFVVSSLIFHRLYRNEIIYSSDEKLFIENQI